MTASPEDLFAHLDDLSIRHETVHHDPLFTVEEGLDLKASMPGAHTKNLFMQERTA